MYYPDEVIEQVRSSNDIVDIVGSYVKLKKQGANYFGLCPFHNEKSPSFSVSPQKQIFYCFGCGAGGNAITFLMKYENLTFTEAVRMLADRSGMKLPEEEYSEDVKKKEEHRKQLFAINKDTATYYYKMLRSPRGAAGMRYFTERKLSPETMQKFGLGFADGSNSDLVKFLRGKGYPDEAILESGVAAYDEKRGLHDKFWNRVIFPIMDVNNRVIGFGGRVMGDGKPKYLNSPETPIFDKGHNLYALNLAKRSRSDQFILCEGYMDVISMHQAGFTQAVASLGTSFTSGQAGVLKRYVKEVILSYDSDAAGTQAALRNNGILKTTGIRARVLDLKPYKDPDEFIKALGQEEFSKRLSNAENVFFFELRQLEKQYDLKDPSGKTDFLREAAKKIGSFEDEIERDNYLRAVASQYYTDEAALRRMVGSYVEIDGELKTVEPVRRPLPSASYDKAGQNDSKADETDRNAQKYLLTWLAEDPSLISQVSRYVTPDDFKEGVYRIAAEEFYRSPGEETNLASIISRFTTEEEQQLAAQLFNTHLSLPERKDDREKALHDIVTAVKKGSIERIQKENQGKPESLSLMIRNKKKLEELAKVRFRLTN